MAVDRVQDGEKDSRNFLPLSHCSSRVAFPRVHFCQRVTIYDTATVTGLCAATAAAGHQAQAAAPNFSSIGGSTEHNSHRNKWCSTAHPPPGFFFKNLLLYTLEGKWCFLLFRYFLYSHRALFFGGEVHLPSILFFNWWSCPSITIT